MAKKSADTDWNAIKIAYIHSTRSLDDIAKEYKVTTSAIERHCREEGWVAARRKAEEVVGREMAARALARRLQQIDEMNENDLNISRAIKAQVSLKVQGAVVRDEAGSVIGTGLSARDISSLATAHTNSQKAGRLALGLSTENNALSGAPVTESAGTQALYETINEIKQEIGDA